MRNYSREDLNTINGIIKKNLGIASDADFPGGFITHAGLALSDGGYIAFSVYMSFDEAMAYKPTILEAETETETEVEAETVRLNDPKFNDEDNKALRNAKQKIIDILYKAGLGDLPISLTSRGGFFSNPSLGPWVREYGMMVGPSY